jgi:hypothetical protein
MGLDAFVSCRCWQDGVAAPPPVPRELITHGEDFQLCLSLPYEGHEDLHRDFDEWVLHRACGHENMEQASVRVTNWAGYRLFQAALAAAGWDHLPTLRAYLPQCNGGSLPAEAAPRALAELEWFTSDADLGTHTYLLDADTGERLDSYVPAYEGVFRWDGGQDKGVGVDPSGLFVLDTSAEPPREVFRSLRCSQEVIGVTPDGTGRLVRLTDAGTSRSVTVALSSPIFGSGGGPGLARYPRRLQVTAMPWTGREFAGVVAALREVLQAAVETGNPVSWC